MTDAEPTDYVVRETPRTPPPPDAVRRDPSAELARVDERFERHVRATMTQAEADRRTLLRLLDNKLLPTTWTGPDGTVYDLGHGLRDKEGDVWTCIGWFHPFDGSPIPVVEWDGTEEQLPWVITTYGPLTKRAEDSEN